MNFDLKSAIAAFAPATDAGSAIVPITRPDWIDQATWDTLDDDTKAFTNADPTAARKAMASEEAGAETPTVAAARDARPHDAKAIEEGLLGKVNDELRSVFKVEIAKAEDAKQIRLRIWVALQRAFGKELEGLPNSGQEKKGNEPFDVYKWTEPKKRGNGVREFTGSVLDDLFDNGIGAELTSAIDKLERETSDKDAGKNYKAKVELARLRSQRTLGRGYMHEGVAFGKQWQAFKSLPNVGVRFVPTLDETVTVGKDGFTDFSKVTKSPDCLVIFTKLSMPSDDGTTYVTEDNHRGISVGTFLSYRVETAIDAAKDKDKVTLENVIASIPPRQKKGSGKTKAGQGANGNSAEGADVHINNVPQYEAGLGDIAALSEDDKFSGDLMAYLNKRDAKGEYINAGLIISHFQAARLIEMVCSKAEFKAVWKEYNAKEKAEKKVA